MSFFKFVNIAIILMAVSVLATFPYNTKYIKDINDVVVVQQSNTCVVLVVKDKIRFVSTAGKAPKQLAKCRNIVKDIQLEVVRAKFKPLNTLDVVEKLGEIGKSRDNFLVYFEAGEDKPSGSITVKTKKPVGLLGNLLATLGLNTGENGLLSGLLDLLGIETTVSKVTTVNF
ncbi:uncharacterized protein ACRADG_009737 [Cochliomyia hominivorax]